MITFCFLLNIITKNVILFLVIIMKLNLRAWMKDFNDSKILFELNIPGSHDSAAKNVQLSHFAKCQDKTIYEQLNIGIRAFDIRVAPKADRLKLVHGICRIFVNPSHWSPQMDMQDVLSQCYNFLEMNSSEVIILQFKNDSNRDQEKSFDILYNTYIKKNPEKWYLENRMPSLGEVRGKIVLIRRCKKENDSEYPQGCGIDFSDWEEQDTAVPDALILDTKSACGAKFIIQDRFKYAPVPRWAECIKPFLDARGTFSQKYIECYLSTAGGFKGPKRNAQYINGKFTEYILKKDCYYGIIYFDFPCADLTGKVISSNPLII